MATPETAGKTPPSNRSWLESNQSAAYALAFALLALYVAPILFVTLALVVTSGFAEPHWSLSLFSAFMANHEHTLREFHTILLPIMSTISVAAFTRKPSRLLIILAITVLAFFTLTVFISVYFDMPSTLLAISGSVDDFPTDKATAFFSRVRETLLTFVMMLLGIKMVTNVDKKAG